jgi:molecular chaperone GrpE
MSTANKINWQDTALRLQAEMDNFRKRQQRRADQTISTEQERLLTIFLPIIDNLERALAH